MKTIKDGIIGLAIGDALGVPVEFNTRAELDDNPVTTMKEHGTHDQPKGTWSDDSSLTFCLAEVLIDGYSLVEIAKSFIDWKTKGRWTPHGKVFDIGIQTNMAINTLQELIESGDFRAIGELKNGADEYSNGNGSLMRILPLYYELKNEKIENGFDKIWDVSALTHGHIRSALSCLVYLVLIDELVNGNDKDLAYQNTRKRIANFFTLAEVEAKEIDCFDRIIKKDIRLISRNEIRSSGYVIDSLEAAIFCFSTTDSFKEALLTAVNLGEDTDTIGAITGSMAGIYYGSDGFPNEWYEVLVRLEEIEKLCEKLEQKYSVIRM